MIVIYSFPARRLIKGATGKRFFLNADPNDLPLAKLCDLQATDFLFLF